MFNDTVAVLLAPLSPAVFVAVVVDVVVEVTGDPDANTHLSFAFWVVVL